jgi:TonB family protein
VIGVGIGLVVALGAGSLFLLRRSGQPVAPPAVAGTASPAPVASEPPAALPSPAPSPVAPTSTVPSAAPSATPTARPAPAASATPSPRRPAHTPAAAPSPAPVVEGQLVELGPDVTPPRKTVDRTAPYPAAARRLHLNGSVTVGFVVDEHGTPIEIAVIESAGPVLDGSALESVRGWRYEPARKDGVKVKVRWVEKLTYRLN